MVFAEGYVQAATSAKVSNPYQHDHVTTITHDLQIDEYVA